MYIQPEALDVDSIEKESMERREKILRKTNTDMTEVLNYEWECGNPSFVIGKIRELNQEVEIQADEERGTIFTSQSIEELVLPEGFYRDGDNSITNKRKTQSGTYTTILVKPIEDYNLDYI